MGIKLRDATLDRLPEGVLRPDYDRSSLTAGILHIGVGNFHRAHQAWYLHRLMQRGLARDWAIVGAGVRPYDSAQRTKLAAQDHLTTLIELNPAGTSAEVMGAMIDYVPVEEGNRPLVARMAEPDIRIVSLTVTEGGYYVDPVTKEFDACHPDILHDAARPDAPRTAFGAMVAALKIRRENGAGPFAGLCCDNLLGNGAVLRRTVASLARLSDPELADWIEDSCSFPNSMVDCIVPATGDVELELARKLGIDDSVPVAHENFRQWVIEDDFCRGRPNWDLAGATFSDDVRAHEAQKIRILNAGHQMLANAGEVLHIETISEAMENRSVRAMFRKILLEEVAPHVASAGGTTSAQYVDLVERRFANAAIKDTVRRVAFDGASRHAGFLLPTIRDALASDAPVEGLALAEALWARMCEGSREDGSEIAPNDPAWDELGKAASRAKENPGAWLELRSVYGDLADARRFARAFDRSLRAIWSEGVTATIDGYLAT